MNFHQTWYVHWYCRHLLLGIVNGWISSIFDSYLPAIHPYFTYRTITWVNLNGFSPNLICALILWRSALGMLIGKFCQFWTELSAHNIIMTGYYRFTFYFSITTCCGYSLEGPHLGSSDQYHSICFCREIKITVFFHWKKRPIWNYVTSNFTGMVRQGH